MNAIQFIKEQGVEKAREVVEGAPELAEYYSTIDGEYYRIELNAVNLRHLKRLVESVDLVNCNGGWNGTKNTITLFQSSLDLGLHHGVDGVDAEVEIPRLKQAIADYESTYSDNDMVDCEILDYPKDYTSPNCKVGVK